MFVKVFLRTLNYIQCFNRAFEPIYNNARSLSFKFKKIDPTPITLPKNNESKPNKRRTTEVLQQILGITEFTAYNIATYYKRLSQTSGVILRYNFQKYKKEGVTKDTILKYPILLAEPQIDEKLYWLKKLPYKVDNVVILIALSLEKLQSFVTIELKFNKGRNGRIKTLSKLLDTPVKKLCEYMVEREFLITMPLERIQDNINLLIEYGITKQEIQKDLWVLRYSTKLIKERLDIAKQHEIESPKTWMVRAVPQIYQGYIKRRFDNKEVLGKNNSVEEYLAEKLNCSLQIARCLIQKQPSLENKSLKKLSETIEFLFSEGFQSHHICRVPKILLHSIETTRTRLKQLQEKGLKVDSLYMLIKSQKQYNQYFEAALKSKKL